MGPEGRQTRGDLEQARIGRGYAPGGYRRIFCRLFCSHHFIKSRFTCHELTMAFMASEGRSAFTAEAAESRGAVCDERLC